MAFTIAATQAAATDGIWPGRGAPSVLGETSAPITVPSGRTRGVIANQGAPLVVASLGEKAANLTGYMTRAGDINRHRRTSARDATSGRESGCCYLW